MARLLVVSDDDKLTGEFPLIAKTGWGYDLERYLPEILEAIDSALIRDNMLGGK